MAYRLFGRGGDPERHVALAAAGVAPDIEEQEVAVRQRDASVEAEGQVLVVGVGATLWDRILPTSPPAACDPSRCRTRTPQDALLPRAGPGYPDADLQASPPPGEHDDHGAGGDH